MFKLGSKQIFYVSLATELLNFLYFLGKAGENNEKDVAWHFLEFITRKKGEVSGMLHCLRQTSSVTVTSCLLQCFTK